MTITMTNNTDFNNGVSFASVDDVKKFIDRYYVGEEGNAYSERWEVEDLEDDSVYDVLSAPDVTEGSWTRK